MKKSYAQMKAEKLEFNYNENVHASGVVCQSGLKKIYTDTGVEMCEKTFVRIDEVWNGDNLG